MMAPRWVRKDNQKIKVNCIHCNGTGYNHEDDIGGIGSNPPKCNWCDSFGKREVLPEIPPPPEMDQKFLDDLKQWIQNYKG